MNYILNNCLTILISLTIEKASLLDNIENSSVCSWEAVEDRNSVQSSSAGNLTSSVLWVPDHCVSRCTGCQTEFWLGRRKHHCRYIRKLKIKKNIFFSTKIYIFDWQTFKWKNAFLDRVDKYFVQIVRSFGHHYQTKDFINRFDYVVPVITV